MKLSRPCERGSHTPGPTSLQLNGWTLNHNSHSAKCHMLTIIEHPTANGFITWTLINAYLLLFQYINIYLYKYLLWLCDFIQLRWCLQHLRGLWDPAGFHLTLHSCRVLSVINVLCSITRSKSIMDLWGFTGSGWILKKKCLCNTNNMCKLSLWL